MRRCWHYRVCWLSVCWLVGRVMFINIEDDLAVPVLQGLDVLGEHSLLFFHLLVFGKQVLHSLCITVHTDTHTHTHTHTTRVTLLFEGNANPISLSSLEHSFPEKQSCWFQLLFIHRSESFNNTTIRIQLFTSNNGRIIRGNLLEVHAQWGRTLQRALLVFFVALYWVFLVATLLFLPIKLFLRNQNATVNLPEVKSHCSRFALWREVSLCCVRKEVCRRIANTYAPGNTPNRLHTK